MAYQLWLPGIDTERKILDAVLRETFGTTATSQSATALHVHQVAGRTTSVSSDGDAHVHDVLGDRTSEDPNDGHSHLIPAPTEEEMAALVREMPMETYARVRKALLRKVKADLRANVKFTNLTES